MSDFRFEIGVVVDIENVNSKFIDDDEHKLDRPFDGMRVRAKIFGKDNSNNPKDIPWSFPLLPKIIQSIPKVDETVLVLYDAESNGQRYYIGPIISQPQFNTKCGNPKDATSLLKEPYHNNPLESISKEDATIGAFPKQTDVAIIGRGSEDILMRYNTKRNGIEVKESEIQLRAGIRKEADGTDKPNMIGNIIFNNLDPAYIQLKYKNKLAKKANNEANSIINMVADRINIMSNKDDSISDNIHDKDSMIKDEKMDEIMNSLHQVPMGDKLVELLEIMKGCIMHHVHPWNGLEQCGDWGGYINKLDGYDINSILSKYVRIS